MFARLKQYPVIVVTGPHRSGTTICGEMIAHDTGYRSVREEGFGWSNEERFREWMARDGVVLQAPFFAHLVHMIPKWRTEALVVFMIRAVDYIHESQARMVTDIGNATGQGIANYRLRQLHTARLDAGVIYENWSEQKLQIQNWIEVDYESLRDHPLWVTDRTHFHFRQTR